MRNPTTKTIGALDVAFTAIASIALALMTVLIVADVTLRYFANAPIFFAHDVVILYLTPLLFFFGFGPTYLHDEHLAVDLLTVRMPSRARAVSEAMGAAIGCFLFGALFWVGFQRAWASFARSEVIASIIPWPAWASYAIVPAGSAMMVLVCILKLVQSTRGVVTKPTIHGEEVL